MCLEFLCCWCHGDEDGPEHHRPQTPANSTLYFPKEHQKEHNQPSKYEPPAKLPHSEPSINTHPNPTKDDRPSKVLSEQSVVSSETEKDEYNHAYPTRSLPPPKHHWEPPDNLANMSNGGDYTNPVRNEPPPNPRWEPYDQNENHFQNGTINNDMRPRHGNPKSNIMAFNGEKTSTTVLTGADVLVPHVGNNTLLSAPVHQPNLRSGAESNVLHTNGHN